MQRTKIKDFWDIRKLDLCLNKTVQQNIFKANYCFSQYFNYKEQVRLQFVFSLRRADFRLVGFVLFMYFFTKETRTLHLFCIWQNRIKL